MWLIVDSMVARGFEAFDKIVQAKWGGRDILLDTLNIVTEQNSTGDGLGDAATRGAVLVRKVASNLKTV